MPKLLESVGDINIEDICANYDKNIIDNVANKIHNIHCVTIYFNMYRAIKKLLNLTNQKIQDGFEHKDSGIFENEIVVQKICSYVQQVYHAHVDKDYLLKYGLDCLTDFQTFKKLFENDVIRGESYKLFNTRNILKPYEELDSVAKNYYLELSKIAYFVYEEFSKCGVSNHAMKYDENIRKSIGIAMHIEWINNNRNTNNSHKKYEDIAIYQVLPYLDVFDIMINNMVEKTIEPEGRELPDYEQEQQKAINPLERDEYYKNKLIQLKLRFLKEKQGKSIDISSSNLYVCNYISYDDITVEKLFSNPVKSGEEYYDYHDYILYLSRKKKLLFKFVNNKGEEEFYDVETLKKVKIRSKDYPMYSYPTPSSTSRIPLPRFYENGESCVFVEPFDQYIKRKFNKELNHSISIKRAKIIIDLINSMKLQSKKLSTNPITAEQQISRLRI